MRIPEAGAAMLSRMKLLALAASVAVIGLNAACGGAEPGETTPTTFTDCLRQQGVEIETARPSGMPTARLSGMPTVRPSGAWPYNVDDPAVGTAMEVCGSLRPSGRPSGRPGGDRSAYLNCLAERGITPSPGQVLPSEAAVCEVLRR